MEHPIDGSKSFSILEAKIDEIYQTYGKRVANLIATKYPDAALRVSVAAEKGIEFDYLYDESQQVAKSYGAICTPDPFLFDSEGKLIFHGRIDNAMKPEDTATEKTMMDNIGLLLDGGKIEKDFDPSIGCSIKWKQS